MLDIDRFLPQRRVPHIIHILRLSYQKAVVHQRQTRKLHRSYREIEAPDKGINPRKRVQILRLLDGPLYNDKPAYEVFERFIGTIVHIPDVLCR